MESSKKRKIVVIILVFAVVVSASIATIMYNNSRKKVANKVQEPTTANTNTSANAKDNESKDSNVKTENKDNKTTDNSKAQEATTIKDVPKSDGQVDISKLSSKKNGWGNQERKDGKTPEQPKAITDLLNKYYGYYVGDTSKKYIYLTFDEGYEYGYTPKILDTLKANDVKASFFVTKPYIVSDKALVKRMYDEGHVIGNHSVRHLSMPDVALTGKDKFDSEFTGVEKEYEDVIGHKMVKFFRPPMGEYSELSLSYTRELGYRTIFWSFAYFDYEPAKQPEPNAARTKILSQTHDGAIYLLHAESKTNADILDSLIKEWKSRGYEFKTLNDLPAR